MLARAGGLLAIAGAAALAGRLAGTVAAVTAAAVLAVSDWWLFNAALGNSEGLLAAAALWAVVAQLAGRHRIALALVLAAALLRPEAWPFLGLYALWLWRTGRERFAVLAVALLPVPLLWFGPDVLGAGGALGASSAARGTASPQSAVYADFPALEVLADFAGLLTVPALLAAVAGAALGGTIERRLAAAALAWVAIVAGMTQAGYAGNPRYNVAAAAIGCVLAGVAAVAVARRMRPGDAARPAVAWVLAAALVAAVLAFTAGDLADQVEELGDRADRRTQLDALVDRGGRSNRRQRLRAGAHRPADEGDARVAARRADGAPRGRSAPPGRGVPRAARLRRRAGRAARAGRLHDPSPLTAIGRSSQPARPAASSHLRPRELDRDFLEPQPAHHPLEHRARVALGRLEQLRVARRRLGELLLGEHVELLLVGAAVVRECLLDPVECAAIAVIDARCARGRAAPRSGAPAAA